MSFSPKPYPASFHCHVCDVSWPPDRDEYLPCPVCSGKTWESNREPIDEHDALSRKRHAEFDRWCEQNNRLDPTGAGAQGRENTG